MLEWEAYAALEPFDAEPRKADWRTAALCKAIFESEQRVINALLAAAGVKANQRPKFVKLDLKDFVLEWTNPDDPKKPPARQRQTWQQQWAIVQGIYDAYQHGARDEQTTAPTR